MTTVQALRAARKLLEPRGAWIQGSDRSADGRTHCLLGAVVAGAAGGQASEATQALARLIPGGSITGWNDEPSRRKSHVLALLDRAIAIEEAKA